ncbi:Alpha/beta-hydrolase [Coniochaeta hoffmannii]|uniref:Alpha/beta-hydrolase n=1 Tax=Coniochaeta hoffmannii TaxID=91930 RepID=A0AA38VZJ9_9PEZI|nr:Alpha/beta-hydrolase [Coniochaeta hoffmannii]
MAAYPEPLVILPLAPPHKQTFILLHGRGSSGEKFGPPLLDTPIRLHPSDTTADVKTLASAFPHARFVFPTAARRRATIYGRALTHQWFDNWKLDPPATDREGLQVPGLRETTAYLHDLVHAEIATLGGSAADVVLGGLSQGCAAALVGMLLWEGELLGGFVGMCGWLPFVVRLGEQLGAAGDGGAAEGDAYDPFERHGEGSDLDPPARTVQWLREELQLSSASICSDLGGTRVFLGHGVEDDRVSVVLGREASACLNQMGIDVSWREYEGVGHWYSGDMLRDIVQFLGTKVEP